MIAKRNHEIDMINGPLTGKIIVFAVPLMLSSLLQLFYNATDMIVVGRYTGSTALAAVGSTSSVINLAVNMFSGLSIGTSIALSQYIGAGNEKAASETVHTSVALSLILGAVLAAASIFFVKPILTAMGSPKDILPQAVTYLKIYFLGSPAILLYNYGSAIMRTSGDTKRPLYFLAFSGIINVTLNLVLVIKFHLGTLGVALATIAAQYISAALVFVTLLRNEGVCRIVLRKIKITPKKLGQLLYLGVPASIQAIMFSLSNIIIQSTINSFGSLVIAGNSAASSVEGFVYVAMNAFSQAALVFSGQNYGARKLGRLNKIIFICTALIMITWGILTVVFKFWQEEILAIYLPNDPKAIKYGVLRFSYIMSTYFLCGTMEIPVGSLRGMGKSILPAAVSLIGVCLLRIVWICTVFKSYPTLGCLYISYPVSWVATQAIHYICYIAMYKKAKKQFEGELSSEKL